MPDPNSAESFEGPSPERPLDAPRLYECYIAALFKAEGFRVELTPTSGDFGIDVLCYDGEDGRPIHAVQCKYLSQPVDVEAVQQAFSGAAHYRAQHLAIVISNQPLTRQARELAESIGVKHYIAGASALDESLPFGRIVPAAEEAPAASGAGNRADTPAVQWSGVLTFLALVGLIIIIGVATGHF